MDGLLDPGADESGEVVDDEVAGLDDLGHLERPDGLRDAAVDRHDLAVDADVVLRLGPAVEPDGARGDDQHGEQAQHEGADAAPAACAALVGVLVVVGVDGGDAGAGGARGGLPGQLGGAGGGPVLGGGGPVPVDRRGADHDRVGGRAGAVAHLVELEDVGDHDRHVVPAAGAQGQLDEALRAGVDVGDLVQGARDGLAADEPREPVGAEQPAVAGARLADGQVGRDVDVEVAEHPHDDRPLRVVLGLLRRDLPGVDEVLHERVVGGDLREDPVAQQVAAGVAQVHHRELVAGPQDRGDRRAHARELRGGLGAGDDLLPGLLERALQLVQRVVRPVGLPVQRRQRGDRDR